MNGIINVYKEKDFTSFDVVAVLRKTLHEKKIGHTGTLDPNAEGVLPVCVGNATKVVSLLTDKNKEYIADFKLGVKTDTLDLTGNVVKLCFEKISIDKLLEVLPNFKGEISQLTPMYSARKVNGKKLYEYAREGIEVERKEVKVKIFELELLEFSEEKQTGRLRVLCEKGTYIRTLIDDIGSALGVGASMGDLLRTRVDIFDHENALRLSEIKVLAEANSFDSFLLPVDILFLTCKKVTISNDLLKYVYNGNPLREDNFDASFYQGEKVRFYDELGNFLAIYEKDGDILKVKGLFFENK